MDFKDNKAIYLQIADNFCEKILEKKIKENDRLPSVREYAVNIEVNPNTVNKSYAYLQDKEIVYNKRGIGYFIKVGAYNQTRSIKKEEFIKKELPAFFKAMALLNIDIDEVNKLLIEYKKGN